MKGVPMNGVIRRAAHWALVGPLIGAALASPILWYFGSPFDHSWRSYDTFLVVLFLAYLIGIPPALLTGAVTAAVDSMGVHVKRRRLVSVATGMLSSTYLAWLVLWDELGKDPSSVDKIAFFALLAFSALLGVISTCGVLALETRRSRRELV
jgi:hypothetical protein